MFKVSHNNDNISAIKVHKIHKRANDMLELICNV